VTPEEYSIREIAELGGVSRRTIRYYVQEGLLPPPHGLGRGARYDRGHLERLLLIKDFQEQGRTLQEVRQALGAGGATDNSPRASASVPAPVSRSRWTRLEILPGLELQVSKARQIPSAAKLAELVEWCERHFRYEEEGSDG